MILLFNSSVKKKSVKFYGTDPRIRNFHTKNVNGAYPGRDVVVRVLPERQDFPHKDAEGPVN